MLNAHTVNAPQRLVAFQTIITALITLVGYWIDPWGYKNEDGVAPILSEFLTGD